MDFETIKTLYPSIKNANITVKIRNADGSINETEVYIIPTVIFVDNDSNKLIVKNLYCILSDADIDSIDVLLSGNVFFNTSLTITPYKTDTDARKAIKVDTIRSNKLFLVMKPVKNKDGEIVAYTTYLRKIKD